MERDARRTTRVALLSVLGVVALLVAGGLYLASFPEAERHDPPRYTPGLAEQSYADDPTDEELAEGDLPAPRQEEGDWPGALDCGDVGRLVTVRDVYTDVAGEGSRRGQEPSASLDLGAVRYAQSADFLCLAWVARRPPRVPMVIDLEIREVRDFGNIWVVRVTLEPDKRRFVTVSWPGVGLRQRPVPVDVLKRYGRVLVPRASMPHRLPRNYRFRVVSRSALFRGGREFFDCVPDRTYVPYPTRTEDYRDEVAECGPEPAQP